MYYNSIIQQLFNFISRYRVEKSVKKLVRGPSLQYIFGILIGLYAQITGKDSLRGIERGMVANYNRLYHLGMTAVAKSTLADAMNRRNPEMFRELFEEILARASECATGHKFHQTGIYPISPIFSETFSIDFLPDSSDPVPLLKIPFSFPFLSGTGAI